jgi:2-phospho-L-lactate transferase/gluconeogenesis factor (CofD/UPF0052 family)
MPNLKFASAVAVHRNNKAKGGYIKNVGLHPHAEGKVETDDNEVDMLHKAVGGAIVDRIIAARDKGPLDEGQNQDGLSIEDNDENLTAQPDNEFSDDLDNQQDPYSEDEGVDETGEGDGYPEHPKGSPILSQIMNSIRKRNMGRR